jgi:hypothetical protein
MSRKCNCKKPPGGGTECPSGSMAVCRLENGECQGSCSTLPSGLNKLELDNWVLRTIKNDIRSLNQTISDEDQEILINGKFNMVNPDGTRIIITFSLPTTDEIGSDQYSEVEA